MKAYLIFGDGTVFAGNSVGRAGDAVGETIFTTSMGGYMETLTDPSYFGQIIVHTFPLIGNYGAISEDSERQVPSAAGIVVRELCSKGSNFRKEEELNDFLVRHGVAGISGIDTREVAKKLRDDGVSGAMITCNLDNLPQKLEKIRMFKVKNAVKEISVKEVTVSGEGRPVALWDFGAKYNITRALIKRGCKVYTIPYDYTAEQIMALKPQGILLSNGGGDPAENAGIIAEIQKLFKLRIPMFGICLGHQMMCLAAGAKTKKLKYGHRGANQPVKDLDSGRVYITSQNHGYAVVPSTLPAAARISMVNANDKSCEGVEFLDTPAFSVQFHPEACGGPQDTAFLFDRFIALMEKQG